MALYRVEHHHETGITPLGRLETAFPHHTSLDLYLPPLLQTGATGWLVLIERTSGRPVARRRVVPRPPRRRSLCAPKVPAQRIV